MEVGMLIMPFCVKITFEIDKNENWLNALDTVNEFFMDKDIYCLLYTSDAADE